MSEKKDNKKTRDPSWPEWITDKGKINEPAFCEFFSREYSIVCMNGIFYNYHGPVDDEIIQTAIYESIKQYVKNKVLTDIKSITGLLKLHCFHEPCKPETNRIHVNNGVITISGEEGTSPEFSDDIELCLNRINIDYNPELWNKDNQPVVFLAFLHDLFEEDDIPAVQEYLGYCLIASTKGQMMMCIIGSGGEGKSRIGVVLQEIFKNNMITSDYQRIENDKFFRYNLVNKLLLLDDDMQMEPLKTTGTLKSIITSEIPVDVEAKGIQSHQEYLYSRILTFGNGSPKSLRDNSYGLHRRLLIITTKPKPADRVDDPHISERFIEEKNKIFCWMLDGLRRLIKNDYQFTISAAAQKTMNEMFRESCNIVEYLEESGEAIFEEKAMVTSNNLYISYYYWCSRNGLEPFARKSFIAWINQNVSRYKIKYDKHIPDNSTTVRGYKGIRTKPCNKNNTN